MPQNRASFCKECRTKEENKRIRWMGRLGIEKLVEISRLQGELLARIWSSRERDGALWGGFVSLAIWLSTGGGVLSRGATGWDACAEKETSEISVLNQLSMIINIEVSSKVLVGGMHLAFEEYE
ncbi:hypothetical protein Tco_1174117 [Tanacetum coccineum]